MRSWTIWAAAIAAGGLGWLLNMLPLDLGWGMHFLLGNCLAYCGMRAFRTTGTVLAVALASSQTLILWDHPWAWGVWSLEALIVATFARRSSPVVTMTLFWIFLGGPLIFLVYSTILDLPQSSAMFVALKQAFNALLSIAIAEIAYVTLLLASRRKLRATLPPISAEALAVACAVALVAVPSCAYLWFDSNIRAREIEERLEFRVASRSQNSSQFLELLLAYELSALVHSDEHDPTEVDEGIMEMFSRIEYPIDLEAALVILGGNDDTTINRSWAGDFGLLQLPSAAPICAGTSDALCVVMVWVEGSGRVIIGRLNTVSLAAVLGVGIGSALLLDNELITPLGPAEERLASMFGVLADLTPSKPILVSDEEFGVSLMKALADGVMVEWAPISEWPMLHMVFWEMARPLVDKARAQQKLLFLLACALTLAGVLFGHATGRAMRNKLIYIAGEAASLARLGVPQGRINLLAVAEVADLMSDLGAIGQRLSSARKDREDLQQTLSDVSERLPIAFYRFGLTADGRLSEVYVSSSASRLFGFVNNQHFLDEFWAAVHEDDLETVRASFVPRVVGHQSLEYRLKRPNGSFAWTLNTWVTRAGPQGGMKVSGVMLDISEWKIAQIAVINAGHLQGLSEVMRGLAHEMNQPLNVIKLAAFNLLERLDRPDFDLDSARARIKRIIAQADRASDLIGRMRGYDSNEEDIVNFALAEPVKAAYELTSQRMQSSGIEVRNLVLDGRLVAQGRPGDLQGVLVALLLNARQAILDTSSGKAFPVGNIELAADVDNRNVVLSVRDTGGGFGTHELARVFQPFLHAGDSMRHSEKSGLGLYVSRTLVERMGGTISVTNVPGGASVKVSLPIGAAGNQGLVREADTASG